MAQVENELKVDPGLVDRSDSEYGTGSSEYSIDSLTSSIYKYRYKNGRRYHAYKEGKYMFPNDELRQDRQNIMHHVYLLMLDDKLHLAPISSNPQRILDVGTGTGIWAIDAGERYPSAEVIGTDLSPIQSSWVSPNVQFQVDDAESGWTFAKDSFDLIHIRHLSGGIHNWEHVLKEAYRSCKPGGYLELAEYEMRLGCDDGSLKEDMALWKFYDLVDRAAVKTGRPFQTFKGLKTTVEQAGFINVEHKVYKVPLGSWAADKKQKKMGAYILLSAESGFEAFGIKVLTNSWEMSSEEAKMFIADVKREANSKKVHGYGIHHIYYAQKPIDTDY